MRNRLLTFLFEFNKIKYLVVDSSKKIIEIVIIINTMAYNTFYTTKLLIIFEVLYNYKNKSVNLLRKYLVR